MTVNSCIPGYGRQCLMNFADAHAAFLTGSSVDRHCLVLGPTLFCMLFGWLVGWKLED